MSIATPACSCYVHAEDDSQQQIKEPMVSRLDRPGLSSKFIQGQASSGSIEVKDD